MPFIIGNHIYPKSMRVFADANGVVAVPLLLAFDSVLWEAVVQRGARCVGLVLLKRGVGQPTRV